MKATDSEPFARCRWPRALATRALAQFACAGAVALAAMLPCDAAVALDAGRLTVVRNTGATAAEGGIAGEVPGDCGTVTLTQSADPDTVTEGLACAAGGVTAETGVARAFAIDPILPLVVNCVDFGVSQNTGGDFTVTVNLLTGNPTGSYAGLTLIASMPVIVPDGTVDSVLKADFAGTIGGVTIPPGSTLVVEILAPTRLVSAGGDGGGFYPGFNDAGQSAPSFIRADACGIANFVDIATIIPNPLHLVMRVDGGPLHWSVVEVVNNSGLDAAALEMTFAGAGGTLFVAPAFVLAPGCPTPTVPSNALVTDTVEIDWGSACVEPDDRVVYIVRSATEPLAFVSGVWRDENGQIIGVIGATRLSIRPIPAIPLELKPFIAIKRQIRYRNRPVYSNWAKPPGQCWQRWCCLNIGARRCEDRWIICFFPDRNARILERGNCIPLTAWRFRRANAFPIWNLIITTVKPPPGAPQDPPGGPPPEIPPFNFAVDIDFIGTRELEVIESDDGGLTGTFGTDWAAAFLRLHDLLQIVGTDPDLPTVFGLPAIAQMMAPGYFQAAESLSAIIAAADAVLEAEFSNELLFARNATAQFQSALQEMAEQFATGSIENPGPFFFAANSLRTLGESLLAASGGEQRFANAKVYLDAIADGMEVSAEAVLTGLETPLDQDAFLWGQVARFQPMCESVGLALLASEIIPLDLADLPSWGPETVPVHVVLHDSETGEIVDEIVERLNEFGELIHVNIGDDGPLSMWIKPATHLAIEVPLTGLDGAVLPTVPTPNGDADGDNCIDDADVQYVLDNLGEGGEFAKSVPSADVNRNGLVEPGDEVIVVEGLGLCGVAQPGGPPVRPCVGDFNDDGVVNGADLGVLLASWGPCPGCPADLNGDSLVNGADLGVLLSNWGDCE